MPAQPLFRCRGLLSQNVDVEAARCFDDGTAEDAVEDRVRLREAGKALNLRGNRRADRLPVVMIPRRRIDKRVRLDELRLAQGFRRPGHDIAVLQLGDLLAFGAPQLDSRCGRQIGGQMDDGMIGVHPEPDIVLKEDRAGREIEAPAWNLPANGLGSK